MEFGGRLPAQFLLQLARVNDATTLLAREGGTIRKLHFLTGAKLTPDFTNHLGDFVDRDLGASADIV